MLKKSCFELLSLLTEAAELKPSTDVNKDELVSLEASLTSSR